MKQNCTITEADQLRIKNLQKATYDLRQIFSEISQSGQPDVQKIQKEIERLHSGWKKLSCKHITKIQESSKTLHKIYLLKQKIARSHKRRNQSFSKQLVAQKRLILTQRENFQSSMRNISKIVKSSINSMETSYKQQKSKTRRMSQKQISHLNYLDQQLQNELSPVKNPTLKLNLKNIIPPVEQDTIISHRSPFLSARSDEKRRISKKEQNYSKDNIPSINISRISNQCLDQCNDTDLFNSPTNVSFDQIKSALSILQKAGILDKLSQDKQIALKLQQYQKQKKEKKCEEFVSTTPKNQTENRFSTDVIQQFLVDDCQGTLEAELQDLLSSNQGLQIQELLNAPSIEPSFINNSQFQDSYNGLILGE